MRWNGIHMVIAACCITAATWWFGPAVPLGACIGFTFALIGVRNRHHPRRKGPAGAKAARRTPR